MKYTSSIRTIILSIILTSAGAISFAQNTNSILDLRLVPEEEINEQFSGSIVHSTDLRTGSAQIDMFNKDGIVISSGKGKKKKGLWYTDGQGRHCIRWNNKDKSSCALIMQDGDGNWVKVKDNEILKSYHSIE